MRLSESTRLIQKNLQDAEALLGLGDYHQASEKFWGAAATSVKAIAEQRGWPHQSHRDLHRVVSTLAQETGRPEVIDRFNLASSLHTNFYEDWLTPEEVMRLAASVRELLNDFVRLAEPQSAEEHGPGA